MKKLTYLSILSLLAVSVFFGCRLKFVWDSAQASEVKFTNWFKCGDVFFSINEEANRMKLLKKGEVYEQATKTRYDVKMRDSILYVIDDTLFNKDLHIDHNRKSGVYYYRVEETSDFSSQKCERTNAPSI